MRAVGLHPDVFVVTSRVFQTTCTLVRAGAAGGAGAEAFAIDSPVLPDELELVPAIAQQVRSYKPDPAHFKECERRIGGKKGWVHVGSDYYYDVEPCIKAKIPVIWVNRNKETLDASQKKPTAEVKNLLEAAKLLGAA